MRRRDAKGSGGIGGALETRRPLLVAAAVSLMLHAALIVAATYPVPRPPAAIAVALVAGPDRGSGGNGRTAPAPAGPPEERAPFRARIAAAPPRPRTPGDRRHTAAAFAAAEAQDPVSANAGRDDQVGGMAGVGGDGGLASGGGSGAGTGLGHGGGFDPRTLCLYCPEPSYPLIARARGWQGSVEVALSVLADGSVDRASLGRSSGYPALDAAAIAVARQSRFRLPGAAGLAAPLQGRIEYRFVLRDS